MISTIAAAFITLLSFIALSSHLSNQTMMRIMGYPLLIDLTLHGGVMWLFLGTSTMGLLQAVLSALMFTVCMRGYRKLFGYQRVGSKGWVIHRGMYKLKLPEPKVQVQKPAVNQFGLPI